MSLLPLLEQKAAFFALGYYAGKMDKVLSDDYEAALRRYQRDMHLSADGVYGPKTDAKLAPQWATIQRMIAAGALPKTVSMRRWHLTYYYIGDQRRFTGARTIPMRTAAGKLLAIVEPRCFVEASLEGTSVLRDGRMVNVAGTSLPADAATFAPVYNIAKANKWLPDLAGYAGIGLSKDGSKVASAFTFKTITPGSCGWPVFGKIEAQPYRTLAADLGTAKRSEPLYKGKGGLVPRGTAVTILEYVDAEVPQGPFAEDPAELTETDGTFTVNDTGGAIFGAHFDVFVGTHERSPDGDLPVSVPERAHIWFPGIEKRIPMSYTYGL